MSEDHALFEQSSLVYPQPVAVACGQIIRARTPQERLDGILKAAEVLTRYCATLALASYAARADEPTAGPLRLDEFAKNLSFGDFLSIAQQIAAVDVAHPLKGQLKTPFLGKKVTGGVANDALVRLLTLRNEIGHDLMGMTEAKALSIFSEHEPDRQFAAALRALEGLLTCPLFVVEEQHLLGKKIIARRLLLMGESLDPIPNEVELTSGLDANRAPYVGVPDGALLLAPFMVWDVVQEKAHFGLYLVHRIGAKKVTFVTSRSDTMERNTKLAKVIADRLAGGRVPQEAVMLATGAPFLREWLGKRKVLEQQQRDISGVIPWEQCDGETLAWFGRALGASKGEERRLLSERLLDGRDVLGPEEVRQVVLLLGTDASVAKAVRRTLIDCRARKDSERRWDDRVEVTANVLKCLRTAIEFVGRNVGVDGFTVDGLQATAGSADYVALREGLVNLFLHQDYSDQSTVAQIEIAEQRAMLFNAGAALVGRRGLAEGGKSQCRNPLLARALRLIGFAELAGSGLRALNQAWRREKRRPPAVESDEKANTFTLILDWRTLPEEFDAFWKQRLGVTLKPVEASALTIAAETGGISAEQLAAYLGTTVDDADAILKSLSRNALIHMKDGKAVIQEHLEQLVQEARSGSPARKH